MFTRKMSLIERHLKDSNHPLRWLQREFSRQLGDYYELFLDENRQTLARYNAEMVNTTQASKQDKNEHNKTLGSHGNLVDAHSFDERCSDQWIQQLKASVTERNHCKFIKQSVLTQYMQQNEASLENSTEEHQQHTQMTESQHGYVPTYSNQQIRTFLVQSVNHFIAIFKTALFKFYRIKSYMRSQDDAFEELVKRKILDREVSRILIQAAKDEHKDEVDKFKEAIEHFSEKELPFWVSVNDAQFWLDKDRYYEASKIRKELFELE